MRDLLIVLTLVLIPLSTIANGDVIQSARMTSETSTATPEKCEGQTPVSIVGRWQHNPIRTENEQQARKLGIDVLPEQTVYPTADSLEMLITSNSFITRGADLFEVETSYRVIGGSSGRFIMEPYDEQGVGDTFELSLVLCGLRVSSPPNNCSTEFCKRKQYEVFEQIAKKAGISAKELKRMSDEVPSTQHPPQYYRLVKDQPAK